MRPVVSLRIPGVDYPTAESVLGLRATAQVDDVKTRGEFWRFRAPPVPECTVEAYLWAEGSKPAARALSMILLPFTMMNVAYWARPPRRPGVVNWLSNSAVGIICRLLGLTLTVTLMLAGAGATMDLLAWQCVGVADCTSSWPQPFNLVGEVPLAAGQRLAVGAAIPLLLLVGLWYNSFSSWRRYERRVEIPLRHDQLTEARFWRGRDWVNRLRASHVLVGAAIVDGLLAFPMTLNDAGHGSRLAFVGYGLLALVAAATIIAGIGAVAPLPVASPSVKPPQPRPGGGLDQRGAAAAYVRAVGRTEDLVEVLRERARSASSPVTVAVRRTAWVTLAVTAATMTYAAWPRTDPVVATGSVPGYANLVIVVSALQVALLLAMGLAMLAPCLAARRTGERMALFGFVAPIIAATAVMLAVAEAAGTLYFTALSIGQLKPSATGRAWEPAPPYPYEWAGLIFSLALGCAVLAGAVLTVVWRRLVRSGARLTDDRDPALRGLDSDVARLIDNAHARGHVLDHVPRLFLILFVPCATLSATAVILSAHGEGPSVFLSSPALANLGTWSIGLLAISLVFLVSRTAAMNPVRRTISTVWALATFWPRAAHPFAAPAHGPRVIADLVSRVTTLSRDGSAVLIAGHSHGALLATVAVSYLPPDVAANTGLLTSGSTATRLIEPFFGAFFNRTVCRDIARSLTGPDGTRWRNLYRLTDPIGGPVLPPAGPDESTIDDAVRGVDRLAPDPPLSIDGLGPDPTPRGHDYYLQDPVFAAEHGHLVAMLGRSQALAPAAR